MDIARAKQIFAARTVERLTYCGYATKAANTLPRSVIFGCLLRLHASTVLRPETAPVTLSRVTRSVRAIADISAGCISSHLQFLRKINYLRSFRSEQDGRESILVPTDAMIACATERMEAEFAAAGECGLLREVDGDHPHLALAYHLAPEETALCLRGQAARHPDMTAIAMREGALGCMMTLFNERPSDGSAVAFDLLAVAERFGVSRSQLWSVMGAAAERGLLVSEASGWRRVRLTDRFERLFEDWLADHLVAVTARASGALCLLDNLAPRRAEFAGARIAQPVWLRAAADAQVSL